MTMKAFSIKNPWAWLIVHGGKNVENRKWQPKFRGRFLVHASKGFDKAGYRKLKEQGVEMPNPLEFYYGCVIGSAELYEVRSREEILKDTGENYPKWYDGSKYALMLRDPEPCKPFLATGKLNFFDINVELK